MKKERKLWCTSIRMRLSDIAEVKRLRKKYALTLIQIYLKGLELWKEEMSEQL